MRIIFLLLLFFPMVANAGTTIEGKPDNSFSQICAAASEDNSSARMVCADIAALDQTLVYNRFGSFNPFGMIFSLKRNLSPLEPDDTAGTITADECAAKIGTESGNNGNLLAGSVRLKDCKRPRPIVLRVNVGDNLLIKVSNYLHAPDPGFQGHGSDENNVVDYSRDFCRSGPTDDEGRKAVFSSVSRGDDVLLRHGEASCLPPGAATEIEDQDAAVAANEEGISSDWPNTRLINFVAQGLLPIPDPVSGKVHPACNGTGAVPPDGDFYCMYLIPQEGTYFFASMAAPAGGEGDGGSIVHGLFGAIMAEKAGSRWYRSQTSTAAFNAIWPENTADGMPRHARTGLPDYENTDSKGVPILNMAMPVDGAAQAEFSQARAVELVHSDINAIIFCDSQTAENDCRARNDGEEQTTQEPSFPAFREFSVFFHDELKTFYTRHFEELGKMGQLAGVKDGFAINYGASGMGAILLANRKGIGPAADCMECLYEEFFLTSWANGDPALLEWFVDDPSNVHHSYLNDPVVYRNFHAGPKETHVFHLHAHQWFAGNDPNRGTYLDSQTVAPQQSFTYNIYHGGLRSQNGAGDGWWDTQGSGNRNRTIGDSIFHCHLYPHFAQGMWALWRVHDVLEDGTRKLPDGQSNPGLSVDFVKADEREMKRLGSVDRETGAWNDIQAGTPIPAIIPLPGEPLPLLPTYADGSDASPMPGYPFFMAGQAGHRPPQAPLDIAMDLGANPGLDAEKDERTISDTSKWLDGGLGRHVVQDGSKREFGFELPANVLSLLANADDLNDGDRGALMSQIVAKAFALGDLSGHLTSANIEVLDNVGTRLERAAMGFHYNGRLYDPENAVADDTLILKSADGNEATIEQGGYSTIVSALPSGTSTRSPILAVNGSAPKPGSPFSDPCGAPIGLVGHGLAPDGDPLTFGFDSGPYATDPMLIGFRRYEVSAVQLDLIVNRAGWHDPQARINVLTARSDAFKDTTKPESISPVISDKEEPFFFRALSGECIEFRHTNELPKDLELDDFQVRTPTDTIGQHIHLVKFDVTSSDGSGNGWNYEDGTFAPDEIATRRCASQAGTLDGTLPRPIGAGECIDGRPVEHENWRLPISSNRDKFQTTVQRWFADPVLSKDENAIDRDRTLRTVFTHDHFGPSSIQQHGFYSALLIEPGVTLEAEDASLTDPQSPRPILTNLCEADTASCATPLPSAERMTTAAWGGEVWKGTRKRLRFDRTDPTHRDYREFALSIADFATLYDPRDRMSVDQFKTTVVANNPALPQEMAVEAAGNKGMKRLYCELLWRRSPYFLGQSCGNTTDKDMANGSWFFAGVLPPAWVAGGTNRDDIHKDQYLAGDIVIQQEAGTNEVASLLDYAIAYRQKAAGMHNTGAEDDIATLAKPVAPPARPESISVDHHDPYLVNYRGSPIPLRVGDKDADAVLSVDCQPLEMNRQGDFGAVASEVETALANGSFNTCSITYQMAGKAGDMAYALNSNVHNDPETPVFEAYQDEHLVFRMIQGAQEVQHSFILYGQAHKRNIDQAFGQGMQDLGMIPEMASSMRQECFDLAREGHPSTYQTWLDTATDQQANLPDSAYWRQHEDLLANCDNVEGFTFAQEIGISEHFEMQGSLRSDMSPSLEFALNPEIIPPTGLKQENVSDYLYSYGTTDAIWNGAWGFLRIFRDPDTSDPASTTLAAIGNRLPTVRSGGGGVETIAPTTDPKPIREASSTGALSCPLPRSGETSQTTDAVIIALETRLIWPDGTDYGGPRFDPDGLMLALLPPEALVSDGLFAKGWDELPISMVLDQVEAAYPNGPEPFVLRVNAGDCVRIRMVNLLQDEQALGGLRDLLGDAVMPTIAPLNTDPIPENPPPGARSATLAAQSISASGLRPSASLALSFGLPGMNLIRNVPLGFGYNKEALLPASNGIASVGAEVLQLYAGRFRIDPTIGNVSDDNTRAKLEGFFNDRFSALMDENPMPVDGQAAQGITYHIRPAVKEDGEQGLFSVFGMPYVALVVDANSSDVFPAGLTLSVLDKCDFDDPDTNCASIDKIRNLVCPTDQAVCIQNFENWYRMMQGNAQVSAGFAMDKAVHWIPYAFGAVPIHSVSDIISHGTQGLIGVIDVVPQNWVFDTPYDSVSEAVEILAGREPANVVIRSASHLTGLGDGIPAKYSVPINGEMKTIREFVLFYQDGLNLWDKDTSFSWKWSDGSPAEGQNGKPLQMIPDCLVCDDSYDRGEVAVNYRSAAFSQILRDYHSVSVEENDDLNVFSFPEDYLLNAKNPVTLEACEGEQIVIRVIHPGGRSRMRSFAMNGYTYDDLFPGFGFPRSALLAPGKTMTAWLWPEAKKGISVWHDGPAFIRAGGVWGLMKVSGSDEASCAP